MKLLILVTFTYLFTGNAIAQCFHASVTTQSIEGYILYGRQNVYRILYDAKVDLYKYNDKDNIYKTAVVNKNGYFNIEGIKPGKYHLAGRSQIAISAWCGLEVVSSENKKLNDKNILIILGGDPMSECGGSSITVENKDKIEMIVKYAMDYEKSRTEMKTIKKE